MKKIIKEWGNSNVIVLSSEDMKIHNLKVGDIVDIDDIVKVKKEGENGK